MENIKNKNNNKLVVRDFVTLGIFWVLYFVIYTMSAPLSLTLVGNLFIHGTCAILWGITFPLLCTKVNKPGVVFIYTALVGIVQIMNFWITGLIIIVGAVIVEIVWRKLDRKKFSTIAICHILVVVTMYLGLTLPLMILSRDFINQIPEYGRELFYNIYDLLQVQGYLFFLGLLSCVVGSIIGALLGKVLLKKHFIKAGIV